MICKNNHNIFFSNLLLGWALMNNKSDCGSDYNLYCTTTLVVSVMSLSIHHCFVIRF